MEEVLAGAESGKQGRTLELHRRVEVRRDVLEEKDGPMLVHGLQEFHGARVAHLPRSPKQRPGPEFLAERYEQFKNAS